MTPRTAGDDERRRGASAMVWKRRVDASAPLRATKSTAASSAPGATLTVTLLVFTSTYQP